MFMYLIDTNGIEARFSKSKFSVLLNFIPLGFIKGFYKVPLVLTLTITISVYILWAFLFIFFVFLSLFVCSSSTTTYINVILVTK